jgi:hypothetical protein
VLAEQFTHGSESKGPTVRLPVASKPILLVVVDTEEEFDWNANFDRNATSVRHMREIGCFQEICDRAGIKPTYVVDYPIATQEESISTLRPLAADGKAVIGAHLHPWVNPPFEEEVNRRNSYPGNLPADLERRKLENLTAAITTAFGMRPHVYKAGRYGFGPNTTTILSELGYDCDLSFSPGFDFGVDGGPDYSATGSEATWLDREHGLLELPATGGFVGHLRRHGAALQRLSDQDAGRRLRLGGILSRSGLVSRIRLSPEGFTFDESRALTQQLFKDGLRIFSFTLHSPSVQPGCTPYVSNDAERRTLLQHIKDYFHYFLGEMGGIAMTPHEVRRYVVAHQFGRAA